MNLHVIKTKIIPFFLLLCSLTTTAQIPGLKFNSNKKFKIVQFTDLHLKYEDPRSAITFERINEVIDSEQPDLVIFTGDLIYSPPADKNLNTVLELMNKKQIPFAVTFGNHDREQGLTNEELFRIIEKNPFNVTYNIPGLSGTGNCRLIIRSSDGRSDASVLYLMDSHRSVNLNGVGGYDYIKSDQIQWYKQESKGITTTNNNNPLPSLAFFHIPLPEYHHAIADENAALYGVRREKVCSPEVNSGLFTAFKEQGDVMGVFVGHDHDNDFAVNWKGILLAYGRYTGGDTVYNNLPNGARVIELSEGERSFKTWIHLKGNEIQQITSFPGDYIKRKRN